MTSGTFEVSSSRAATLKVSPAMTRLSFFEYYVARRVANDRDRQGLPPIKAAQVASGIAGLAVFGMFGVVAVTVALVALSAIGINL